MNLLLAMAVFCGMDLYFVKDSTNLLVRVVPEIQSEQIILYHSFSDANWDSMVIQNTGKFYEAVIKPPDNLNMVGFYIRYANGTTEDNEGNLYLYEVKKSPKMIMPFSLSDLEIILNQAKKKIDSGRHIDEAITLLDYVANILAVLPVVKESNNELKRNELQAEVENLRKQITK